MDGGYQSIRYDWGESHIVTALINSLEVSYKFVYIILILADDHLHVCKII